MNTTVSSVVSADLNSTLACGRTRDSWASWMWSWQQLCDAFMTLKEPCGCISFHKCKCLGQKRIICSRNKNFFKKKLRWIKKIYNFKKLCLPKNALIYTAINSKTTLIVQILQIIFIAFFFTLIQYKLTHTYCIRKSRQSFISGYHRICAPLIVTTFSNVWRCLELDINVLLGNA